MTTWMYTFGELRRRRGRTLLTLTGIAIGVAILVAAGTAIESARGTYRDLFELAGNGESLEIVAPSSAGFDGAFGATVEPIPGVRAVCPRIIATTALADFSGSTPARVFGLEPESIGKIQAFSALAGRAFDGTEGVWIDARTADAHGWGPGATVTLLTASGETDAIISGVVEPRGAIGISGSCVLYLPIQTAQRWFELPGQVNSVEVLLADGAEPEDIKKALLSKLPTGLHVQSSSRRGELSHSTLRSVEHGLTALSLISLVTAGFVVLNTVLLNLTERRKQLAILRALGATQWQVRRLVLREALLVGVAGSVAGITIGLFLASALTGVLQKFLGVNLPPTSVSPWLIAVAFVAGPGLTITATFVASRRAARRKPIDDLVNPTGSGNRIESDRGPLVGVLLIFLSALTLAGCCEGRSRSAAASALLAPSVAGLLAGCAMCLPVLVIPLLHASSNSLYRAFGVSGRLALIQLLRRPARTGLTAGVLFIAIASAVSFGHWLVNTLADLNRWYRNAIVADFLVRGSAPDSSFLLTAPIPERLENDIAALSCVERVDKVAFLPAEVNGRSILALARTFTADQPPTLDLREGNPAEVLAGLLRGEVVLGTGLAQRLGVRIGDTITLDTRQGPATLRVAGIAVEYAAGGDAMYIDWRTAKNLLAVKGVHAFLVTARPETSEILALQLQVLCFQRQLMFQSNADLRGVIGHLLERIVVSLWVIVTLTFAIASLGVANTLTLNVLEQARELSVLRAIGMVSAQTRQLVLVQAFLLGTVSLSLGAAAGIGLAFVVNHATNMVFGQEVVFRTNLPLTGGCLAVGIVIITAAALVPARHAVKISAISSNNT